ncbi:MAG TPA: M14 metallopeptidase family protein [Flavobacterium sp.]|uniref:M14 family metallopeptidase n=1 Tax=Flavobacterium sp. TaxID=239 RepID=UPI002B4B636B|nr:M14 metallopeptidase family protein [Flavobacterium sp.]HLO73410.1 M14 metallopeptidase family protein [Flavobacterium sp.]
MNSLQIATHHLESSLIGKYIHLESILPLLKSFESVFEISEIGKSVQQRSMYQVKIGTGKTKILVWSQMHGNEPTTTKGLFDFFNFLATDSREAIQIKSQYTLLCVPMLNPDGAFAYTRENANGIDLNRDAYLATQPEMKLLKALYENFKPDYCYNLHDQRTIFGTDELNLPATISFLAPAYNEERTYNEVRIKAIEVINKMNNVLMQYIPNQIGRFDDSYNVNCTGDYFTTQNTPTILFEAGHYPNDYNREESRKYVFIALLSSFFDNYENVVVDNELRKYLRIPQNNKCFFDFIYKNVKIIDNSVEKIINFAAQYQEILVKDEIHFEAIISKISDLENYSGHVEYDCESLLFSSEGKNNPEIGAKATFTLNNLTKFNNGVKII